LIVKKKTRKGSDHPNSRFTLNEIKEIRRLWNTLEFKQTEIAQMYNTSQPVIQRIVTNKSWVVPEGE
jgi:DNA-binding transcriptional regulator YiaG